MRQPAGRRQEAGAGDDQRRQQEQAGAAEAGGHDAFGRLARVEHALAEHRVGGIPDAGGHGKGDAGRVDRRAAVAREQQTPTAARAVAWAQRALSRSPLTRRPSTPAAAGPVPMATTVPTATPVSLTAAKKDSW